MDRFCVLIKTNRNVSHRIFSSPCYDGSHGHPAVTAWRVGVLPPRSRCYLPSVRRSHLQPLGCFQVRGTASPSSGGSTLLYKGWARLDQGVQTLIKELIKHHIISCQNSCCKDYRPPHHTDSPAWFLSETDLCLLKRVRYILFSSLYKLKHPGLSPFSHCSLTD